MSKFATVLFNLFIGLVISSPSFAKEVLNTGKISDSKRALFYQSVEKLEKDIEVKLDRDSSNLTELTLLIGQKIPQTKAKYDSNPESAIGDLLTLQKAFDLMSQIDLYQQQIMSLADGEQIFVDDIISQLRILIVHVQEPLDPGGAILGKKEDQIGEVERLSAKFAAHVYSMR